MGMIEDLFTALFLRYNYYMAVIIMLIGVYAMIAKSNLVKKIIGLNIFQTAIFLFYISIADVQGGTAPILIEGGSDVVYVNPVPHVLILTAIVVAVSTTAVALSIAIRIHEEYGSIEEENLLSLEGSS
jgi:multicomponent Na+:H+ antiporter subunit C